MSAYSIEEMLLEGQMEVKEFFEHEVSPMFPCLISKPLFGMNVWRTLMSLQRDEASDSRERIGGSEKFLLLL